MLTALLISSLTFAPATVPAVAQDPPLKVWLNKRGDVERGERVRVYVEADADGYLMVLHAEPDGRIRVLFPLDPFDDNFVRGRTEYEIEGRGGREAFRVYEEVGVGTVYAAFSRDPFQLAPFSLDDHWDYRIFETWRITEDLDAEAELTAMVQQMAGGVHFDYDLTPYYVGQRWVDGYRVHHYYTGYPTYFGINLRYGGWYPWSYRVYAYSTSWVCSDPFWWDSWQCDPWYYGYAGWRGGSWYDPWYYRPYYYGYYDPYGYGYYPYGYYGYRTVYTYPSRYGHASQRFVIGRYTFKPLDRSGFGQGGITARRRFVSGTGGTRPVLAAGERRAASQAISAGARRTVGSTPVQLTANRRTAPNVLGPQAVTRRTPGTGTAAARVQPDGWGITDGRRTVTPTQQGIAPTTTRRTADGVTPTRGTDTPPAGGNATVRRRPDAGTPAPTRDPSTGSQATPTRRPATSSAPSSRPTSTPSTTRRPDADATPSTPERRSTAVPRAPSTSSRSTPSANPGGSPSRPAAQPSVPRSTPSTSSSTRRPSSSPAPRPSTSSGSSRPSSSPPSRPSTSSTTRRPSSSPAPRPSTSSGGSRPSSSPPSRPSTSSGGSRPSSSPPSPPSTSSGTRRPSSSSSARRPG